MNQQRRAIKKMQLEEIQATLRLESGTPSRRSDRVRRYLLWRQLDRIIRHQRHSRVEQNELNESVLLKLLPHSDPPPLHFCVVCNAPAVLGVGCFKGKPGEWFCSKQHLEEREGK